MQTVLIVLASLVSEGTPHIALDLCGSWLARGVRPVILVLDPARDELRPAFQRLGVDVIDASIGNTGKKRFLALAAEVRRVVRAYRATGVVSMLFGWHAFIAIGARQAGARTIVHIGNHPGGLPPATRRKLRVLIALGAPFTSRYACCSDYVRDSVVRTFGLGPAKCVTIYNGVDLHAFANSDPRPATPRTILTMVARLEVHKDQPTLIDAVAILRDRGIDVELRLVGDGSRRAELEAQADRRGVADRVIFAGARDDIAAVLADATIFAFATTKDEGLGIALIEAMAAGVPIVASDVGACRETLDDGRCGRLVTAGDPAAMADGILATLAEGDATADRVAAARARVVDCFDADAMSRRYLDVLR